jgi:hypothetical protein
MELIASIAERNAEARLAPAGLLAAEAGLPMPRQVAERNAEARLAPAGLLAAHTLTYADVCIR